MRLYSKNKTQATRPFYTQHIKKAEYWDASNLYASAEEATPHYPADVLFVNAPDFVREGWGYADGQFVRPTPPAGWVYDDDTGTFYPADGTKPEHPKTITELETENNLLKAQVQAVTQRSDFMEDCVAEMAAMVYV